MSVGRAFGDEMTGQSDIIISCHDSPKSTTRSRLLADSRGVTCHRHRHHPQHVVVLRWGLWTILGLLVRNTMSSSKLTVLGFSSSDLRRTSTIRRQASRYGLMKPTSYSSVTESSKNVVIRTASAKDLEWEVFVDQSKASLDKGGSATLDAFLGLAPPSVHVSPAILPKSSKSKGPSIRCISHGTTTPSFDVGNVDSVDKVFRVLTKHMKVKGVSTDVCDCLKYKYRGNGYLEDGKVTLAIDAYNSALETGVSDQEGIILLMRAAAYLKRAAGHKEQLKIIVNELIRMVPESSTLQTVYEEAAQQPILASSIFRQILEKTATQKAHFRKTQYRHGLYQYALLKASQDALRATQVMPQYGIGFFRTGEILAELWKLKESMQYYERAMSLDPTLSSKVPPLVERLRRREELLESARAYGWTDNALRLALDVSGG